MPKDSPALRLTPSNLDPKTAPGPKPQAHPMSEGDGFRLPSISTPPVPDLALGGAIGGVGFASSWLCMPLTPWPGL